MSAWPSISKPVNSYMIIIPKIIVRINSQKEQNAAALSAAIDAKSLVYQETKTTANERNPYHMEYKGMTIYYQFHKLSITYSVHIHVNSSSTITAINIVIKGEDTTKTKNYDDFSDDPLRINYLKEIIKLPYEAEIAKREQNRQRIDAMMPQDCWNTIWKTSVFQNSMCVSRLKKEFKDLEQRPPIGISAGPDRHLFVWSAVITGPMDTPYQHGIFHLRIDIPRDYPFRSLQIRFITKIYHCNIGSNNGKICMDLLQDGWSPVFTICKTLLSIQSLLINANPDNPLMPGIANLYHRDRQEHDKICREWTLRYAME